MNINTNNPGSVAAAVWANATRSLTLGGAAVIGAQIQTPVTVSGINLAASGTTVILNYAGTAGVLLSFGYTTTTTVVGVGCSAQFEIVIDGGSTVIIPIIVSNQFGGAGLNICSYSQGSFGTAIALITLNFPIQFSNSVIVRLNITSPVGTSGTGACSAFYAHV